MSQPNYISVASGVYPSGNAYPIYQGQALISAGNQTWQPYTAALGTMYANYELGICVSQIVLPGNTVTVQTFGRIPYNLFNLGAGDESTIIFNPNGTISRGTIGQVVGFCDKTGAVTMAGLRSSTNIGLIQQIPVVGSPIGSRTQLVPVYSPDTQTISWSGTPSVTGNNVKSFGAAGDGFTITDGAMTAGSNVLTCSTSKPFLLTDVGKLCTVQGTSPFGPTAATITEFISSSVVHLSTAMTSSITYAISSTQNNGGLIQVLTTVEHYITTGTLVTITGTSHANGNYTVILSPEDTNSSFTLLGSTYTSTDSSGTITITGVTGATVDFGTDDTVAINLAIAACAQAPTRAFNSSKVVNFPPGIYMVSSGIDVGADDFGIIMNGDSGLDQQSANPGSVIKMCAEPLIPLAGTATVTGSSGTVTFTSQQFLQKGTLLRFSSQPTNTYTVVSPVAGATGVSITPNYTGSTLSGVTVSKVGNDYTLRLRSINTQVNNLHISGNNLTNSTFTAQYQYTQNFVNYCSITNCRPNIGSLIYIPGHTSSDEEVDFSMFFGCNIKHDPVAQSFAGFVLYTENNSEIFYIEFRKCQLSNANYIAFLQGSGAAFYDCAWFNGMTVYMSYELVQPTTLDNVYTEGTLSTAKWIEERDQFGIIENNMVLMNQCYVNTNTSIGLDFKCKQPVVMTGCIFDCNVYVALSPGPRSLFPVTSIGTTFASTTSGGSGPPAAFVSGNPNLLVEVNTSSYAQSFAITGATDSTPIFVDTSPVSHGLRTGQWVSIWNCAGLTAMNGRWIVTVVSATEFSLDNSDGSLSDPYTGGGLMSPAPYSRIPLLQIGQSYGIQLQQQEQSPFWTEMVLNGGSSRIRQEDPDSDVAPANLQIFGANAFSGATVNKTPGYIDLASGTPVSGGGEGGVRVLARGNYEVLLTGKPGGQGGMIYLGGQRVVTPTAANYTLYGDDAGAFTVLNGARTDSVVRLSGGTQVFANFLASGVNIQGAFLQMQPPDGQAVVIEQLQPGTDTATQPMLIIAQNAFTDVVTIASATNAHPVVCTLSAPPKLGTWATGNSVTITGGAGNTAINGTWTITVSDPTTFSIGTTGNGTYTPNSASAALQTITNKDGANLILSPGTGSAGGTSGYLEINPAIVTTGVTTGAGPASPLPATPEGYLVININGTNKNIPYYGI